MTDVELDRDAFEMLKKECIACRKCSIGGGNVFSNMSLNADIMVVGQNPGTEEVKEGRPFVGVSGAVFDEALQRIVGIGREELYVTNVVKCFSDRKPAPFEIDNCREYLDKEVKLLKPRVAVALGSLAFKVMTGMSGVVKHCGEVVFSPRYKIPVIATPSPYGSDDVRMKMLEDALRKLKEVVDG